MKPKYKTSFLGFIFQLFGLLVFFSGLIGFIFDPFVSFLGIFLGLVLVALGGRLNHYVCPECRNAVHSRSVKMCPACRIPFD